jgi:hypothetical protein
MLDEFSAAEIVVLKTAAACSAIQAANDAGKTHISENTFLKSGSLREHLDLEVVFAAEEALAAHPELSAKACDQW